MYVERTLHEYVASSLMPRQAGRGLQSFCALAMRREEPERTSRLQALT